MFSFFRPISASSISLSKKRPANSHASGPSYAPIAISISGFLVFTQTAPSWKRKDLLASWNSSRSLSVSLCLYRGLGMLGDFYHFHCSFTQHIYLILLLNNEGCLTRLNAQKYSSKSQVLSEYATFLPCHASAGCAHLNISQLNSFSPSACGHARSPAMMPGRHDCQTLPFELELGTPLLA